MARMLGRWLTGGCHCRPRDNRSWGPDCAGHKSDQRRAKRREQRAVADEIATALADPVIRPASRRTGSGRETTEDNDG